MSTQIVKPVPPRYKVVEVNNMTGDEFASIPVPDQESANRLRQILIEAAENPVFTFTVRTVH